MGLDWAAAAPQETPRVWAASWCSAHHHLVVGVFFAILAMSLPTCACAAAGSFAGCGPAGGGVGVGCGPCPDHPPGGGGGGGGGIISPTREVIAAPA